MRLRHHLAMAQHFCENVGYWRFSAFASSHFSQAEQIQKIGRIILSVFVIMSAYDFVFHSLPFKVKIVVHGILLISISSLAFSLLFKTLQKNFTLPMDPHGDERWGGLDIPLERDLLLGAFAVEQNKVNQVQSHVKRQLLPEFNKVAGQQKASERVSEAKNE